MSQYPDPLDRQISQLKSIYPSPTSNSSAYTPKQAVNRVSAENLSRLAKQLGRCGDINPITGYVCVTQPHEDDVEHMAIQIGGPNDGKVYSTWGALKPNTNQIPTQKLPKADDG
jgi:hypothetical protein